MKATNKYGRTPLDVAKGEDVAALLRKSGGIPGVQGEYEEQSGSHRETESESDPATPPKRPEMFGWSRPKLNAATLSGAIGEAATRPKFRSSLNPALALSRRRGCCSGGRRVAAVLAIPRAFRKVPGNVSLWTPHPATRQRQVDPALSAAGV